jgi:hypothetical protein
MSTRDLIENVLAHRRFTEFIGMKEDLWFEAKPNHGFDLATNPNDRIELSKDVSALANAEGGFLIVGLHTEPVLEEQTDRVDALDLLLERDFPLGQFRGVISSHVFPSIRGLRVEWIPSSETPDRGVGCIVVPEQNPDDQPFLMKRVIDEGVELRQIVFGIARRSGTSNLPLTVEQLHRAVQQGKSSVPDRLTRIEAQLSEVFARLPAPSVAGQPSPADALADRLNRALADE